jgi:putative toxin-antitoxin system antitoxin component (TIGR02293 family)
MATLAIANLPYYDNLRVAKIVEGGIPARALKAFGALLSLPIPAVADLVLMSPRTLERRIADNATLEIEESERVVRLGRIFAKAKEVFEDADEAARWLNEPLEPLDGRTPLQVSRTEPGARAVEQVLGRIEHGVFS